MRGLAISLVGKRVDLVQGRLANHMVISRGLYFIELHGFLTYTQKQKYVGVDFKSFLVNPGR